MRRWRIRSANCRAVRYRRITSVLAGRVRTGCLPPSSAHLPSSLLSRVTDRVENQLSKSQVYDRLFDRTREIEGTTPEDVELLLAIVEATKRVVIESYGAKFHVLMWEDKKHRHFDTLVKGVRDRQIDITLVNSEILPPDFDHTIRRPIENHPNSEANKIIAEFVLNEIVRQ